MESIWVFIFIQILKNKNLQNKIDTLFVVFNKYLKISLNILAKH